MSKHAILRTLENQGPMTNADLVESLTLDFSTIWRHVRGLKAKRVIHISAWVIPRGAGRITPVYAFGYGSTAPRPKAKTDVERMRHYREIRAVELSIRRSGKRSMLAGGRTRKDLGLWGLLLK